MSSGKMNTWGPWVDAGENERDSAIDREVLSGLLRNPSFHNFVESLPEVDDPSEHWSDDEDLEDDEDMTPEEMAHHRAFYPSADEEVDEAMALRIKRAMNQQQRGN